MSRELTVMKTGYDYETYKDDPDKIIYSSRYDTLKYYASGSTSLVVSGSDVETTITHNLGYAPVFFVYADKFSPGSSYSMLPLRYLSFIFYGSLEAWADTTKIYIKFKTNSATNTFNIYYKIFTNKIDL